MPPRPRWTLCAVMLVLMLLAPACARRRNVPAPSSPPSPAPGAPPSGPDAPAATPPAAPPSSRPAPSRPAPSRPAPTLPSAARFSEEGLASWYGHPYHGRRAANGEVYDMDELTAAHRTLPFDSWVSVHNKLNGKQVTVRITDRGPFVEGRVIDLSRAAARAIDMIGPGTAPVRLALTRRPPDVPADFFAVQVGAFAERERAEALQARMQREYGSARSILRPGDPPLYRVLVGREEGLERAQRLAARLRAANLSAFVVRLDD